MFSPMNKSRNVKSLKKSCWNLASKIVRTKEPLCARCVYIARQDSRYLVKRASEVHHIFSRKNNSTFLDFNNLIPLCSGCHTFSRLGFEQSPYTKENMAIVIGRIGEEEFDKLQRRANGVKKFTVEELIELETYFKSVLEELED